MPTQTESKIQLPCPAEKIIFHRPPMLLIENLLEREGDQATANTRILTDNICFDENRGILPEFFIEIMAQTMAAANGFDFILEDKPPKDGFIVGLDKFVLTKIPSRDDELLIKIDKIMEFGSMQIMRGEVFANDVLIATGELKVWEQEKNEE